MSGPCDICGGSGTVYVSDGDYEGASAHEEACPVCGDSSADRKLIHDGNEVAVGSNGILAWCAANNVGVQHLETEYHRDGSTEIKYATIPLGAVIGSRFCTGDRLSEPEIAARLAPAAVPDLMAALRESVAQAKSDRASEPVRSRHPLPAHFESGTPGDCR